MSAERSEPDHPRAPAAEKALDILEFMAVTSKACTQTEIAHGVGRSIHEVHRVIQLLERRGYLERARADDRFVLTMRLFTLAHRSPAIVALTSVASEPMQRLAETARQSCHIAILTGCEVTIVAQVPSPEPMFYGVALGARFPVHETSSGLVLMAGLPREDRKRLIARLLEEGATPASMAETEAKLDVVAESKFDVRPSMVVPGVINISYPVLNHSGRTVAALTLPYLPVSRETPSLETTQAAVRGTADRISQLLGGVATRTPAQAAEPPPRGARRGVHQG